MPGRPTFRRRVALAMSALALLVLTLAGTAIYFGTRYVLRASLDKSLLAIARTEVASAIDRPDGRIHVHDERWVPISLPGGTGYEKFALIKGASRRVAAQTANVAEGPPLRSEVRRETQALRGKASFGIVRRGADRLRAIYYPLRDTTGAHLVAIVAVPTRPIDVSLDLLLGVLLTALLVGGAGAAWGASRLATRLTQPLDAIAGAARAIGGDDLGARIPDPSPDAELRALTSVLNDALGRLQAALAVQRRLVADASHELRTPLTNLRGTVEVALRYPRAAADYRQTLEACGTEIERLCRLVDDLLVLSRADAGQLAMDCTRCDLAALAAAAVHAHGARAEQAGVRLTLDAPLAVPIHGDADRLRGVLDNLLDNALRFAPRGTPVTVAARRDVGRALLSVRDRGPGLTTAQQAHVFERFYRADPARQRNAGGAGLGLAIAKAIAEAHGGRLTLDSRPGVGATFSLDLPLAGDAPP
jgi:heavy metal sensor kinase